jgi:serine/threonine protein phosphatase PrpC
MRRLQAAAATDAGRERANNEDRVLCEPDLGIFAVIDGVGGETAGEVAAETALEVLRARLSRRTTGDARLVREAIALANRQIYERALAEPRLAGMSCVLTVAVLDGDKATVGHVGDSRLYSLAPGTIRKVTPDHSPVGAREDAGDLSEAEAMRHPRRNEIYRDVGTSPHEPEDESWIDVLEVPLAPDGALLLCSDGLSDMVPSRDILEAVERNAASPQAAVRALIERANAAGGKDNVSVVLVEGEGFADAMLRRRREAEKSAAAAGRSSARSAGRSARTSRASGPVAAAPVVFSAAGGGGSSSPPARSSGVSGVSGVSGDSGGSGAANRGSGAAWARSAHRERAQGPRLGRAAKALLVAVIVAAAAAALFYFRAPLWGWARGLGGGSDKAPAALLVGIGDGGFATIGEALAQARPGQTIEVAPGEYRERLVLRSGVGLVSRVPRAAVLLPPAGGGPGRTAGTAVEARGIAGARFSGFRVAGEPPVSWSVGVRLDGSEVVLEEVEVSGAGGAGIEIAGADRSTVRTCFVHQNGGAGIAVGGEAAPRLLGNLIAFNGNRAGAPAPGVEVREGALPLLAGNRIEANGGAGVTLTAPERSDEIFRWNSFGVLPREQAVRVAAAAAGARPAAGLRATGRPAASRPAVRPPARSPAVLPPAGAPRPAPSTARPAAGAARPVAPTPRPARGARGRR